LGLLNDNLQRAQLDLARQVQTGQLSIDQYNSQSQRLQTENQLRIAQLQDATQRQLGQQQNQNQRYGTDVQRELGLGNLNITQQQANTQQYGAETQRQLGLGSLGVDQQRANQDFMLGNRNADTNYYQAQTGRQSVNYDNANTQYANQTTRQLGQGQLQNQGFSNQTERIGTLGALQNTQYGNQTNRMNVNNQFTLGQGQLGFQNRELDVNDAYRYRQLQQEADIQRERMQADLTNQRVATFGRTKAPNTRMAQSFR
jgi:hypothetical protein